MNIFDKKSKKQRGATMIEFSIVATLFFVLIFSIIEFGRLLLSWHTLNEISRRSARLACVCQITDTEQLDAIVTATIDNAPLPNFTTDNIQLRYLKDDGEEATQPLDDSANFLQIKFVEAKIVDYTLDLIIPLDLLGLTFTSPDFMTLLPRESLGITRTGKTDC